MTKRLGYLHTCTFHPNQSQSSYLESTTHPLCRLRPKNSSWVSLALCTCGRKNNAASCSRRKQRDGLITHKYAHQLKCHQQWLGWEQSQVDQILLFWVTDFTTFPTASLKEHTRDSIKSVTSLYSTKCSNVSWSVLRRCYWWWRATVKKVTPVCSVFHTQWCQIILQ